MFEPIEPMEPKSSSAVLQGEQWISQIKWDGVRILSYYDGTCFRLVNRNLRERTLHYPELALLREVNKLSSFILDGEMIALGKDGLPSFHEVMRRDAIRRVEKVDVVRRSVPVSYMVFDILFLNGEWLTGVPYSKRLEILQSVIPASELIQVVFSHSDGQQLFDVVKERGMEGIVQKRADSPYRIGEKTGDWVKVKNYRDVIAIVGGFTVNDGGVVNSLLLGLYGENDELTYIGHCGTGKLNEADWRHITSFLTRTLQSQSPFSKIPERRKGALWVSPRMTVKVQFMEWTSGGTLRQPSVQAVVDVPPEDCRLGQA